jgi:hypothetical protein
MATFAGSGQSGGVTFHFVSSGTVINNADGSILGATGILESYSSGIDVFNHGAVYGLNYEGIYVGTTMTPLLTNISNDGNIYGHSVGIFDQGQATITNIGTGSIYSDQYGISLSGTSAIVTNDVHATISGPIDSIFTQEGDLVLKNFGTLHGTILCNAPLAENSIFNRGVINGNVIFQSGNATFTDAGLGHVTGLIEGGAGTDTFTAGKAEEFFAAGTGADTFVFNSGHFSPVGPKHDVIFNFSSPAGDEIDMHHIQVAGKHLVFIGTHTFAHYHAVHPAAAGLVRFEPGAHQLQATVDGDFAHPDFVVALPGVTALNASELILV